jgi:hypothetical protein
MHRIGFGAAANNAAIRNLSEALSCGSHYRGDGNMTLDKHY